MNSTTSLSTIPDDIRKICMQTDYIEEVAKEKLGEFNGDINKVIRDYLGVTETPVKTKKTLNQEIYRQFREKVQIKDGCSGGGPTSTV